MEGDNIGLVCKDFFCYHWRGMLTILVPLVLAPMPIIAKSSETSCFYVILVMSIFWAFDVIPAYITAMIPIVIYPVLGVLSSDAVCKAYINDPIFLFLGALIIALSFEFSKLNKRLAMWTLVVCGAKPRSLQLVVMIFTLFISMCLNNVATTIMMCPVVSAVLEELESQGVCKQFVEPGPRDEESKYAMPSEENEEPKYPSKVTISFYLAVAYAATIGGCVTLVGSTTNLVYKGVFEKVFPNATETIELSSVFCFAFPIMIIDVFLIFIYLQVLHMGFLRGGSADARISVAKEGADGSKKIIKQKLSEMQWTAHEVQVIVGFLVLIFLLFTRRPGSFPGWGDEIHKDKLYDSFPMIFIVILFFMLPMNYTFCKYCFGSAPFTTKSTPSLITWKVVNTYVPWGVLFLLGSGYASIEAIKESNLAEKLMNELKGAKDMGPAVLQILCILVAVLATIFTSNVASCSVLASFFCELAKQCDMHPIYLLIPTGVACSLAFHLPVSTPPNAIVASYAKIKTRHMLVAGIGPTITSIILLIIFSQVLITVVFPESGSAPDWIYPPKEDEAAEEGAAPPA